MLAGMNDDNTRNEVLTGAPHWVKATTASGGIT